MSNETLKCLYCLKVQTIPERVQECSHCGGKLTSISPTILESHSVSPTTTIAKNVIYVSKRGS